MSAARGSAAATTAWGGLGSLFVAAIVLMVNYLAMRHYVRWDWTSQGLYTLSERTLAELRELDRPVDVYVFLGRGDAHYDQVRELLERYRAASARISVRFVDPDRNPAEYRVLAQRFDVGTGVDVGGRAFADVAVVVASGDRHWKITRDEFLSYDLDSFDDAEGPKVDVRAEQALTGAIVELRTGRATKVCVSAGHGEWGLEGAERSLHALRESLRRENVTLETVETRAVQAIASDCDALFVLGPLRAFSEPEVARIRSYVTQGGNALFALDPVLEDDRVVPTGLEALLRDWGVDLDATVVLERDPRVLVPPPNYAGPFLAAYGEHAIVEGVLAQRVPVALLLARSVRPRDERARPLLLTSERGYAESTPAELLGAQRLPEPGEGDHRGPVAVAVALEVPVEAADEASAERAASAPAAPDAGTGAAADAGTSRAGTARRGGRVVVVGDSDLLQPELMEPVFANADFVAAVTGWLTERRSLIAIGPKKLDDVAMRITEDDLGRLALDVLVLLPLSAALLGFGVWWSRRR
ncbi:MAG: GldG family protein [Myxococcota bacterium]|nr:GldG family protein [Myxococcota bacterium]MDW8363101.1 GldG family protein [Myxococcales bacterium]